MKRIKQILKNCTGFTLAEVLLATLILLMVSVIVATGIPSAKNAYEKVVLASNAEVLLSTTMNELRNELGTARNVNQTNDQQLTYRNSYTNSKSEIFKADGNSDPTGTIMLQRYVVESGMGQGSSAARLTSEKASDGLYATYGAVDYDKKTGIVIFSDLAVKRKGSASALVTMPTFSIRVFSAEKTA